MIFFFKQKTAYEMLRSLVGSEMCIRDSGEAVQACRARGASPREAWVASPFFDTDATISKACLLYTSDAADDLLCVDLGGRRIIKKKKRFI